jgi:signal transduction histidine kinase
MESLFLRLAHRRVLGVGLALVAEICLVAVLTLAPAPVEAGIPGVVAAAIAGTVAVVFGVVDGVVLALIGALLFAILDGWSGGAFAALMVWPSVVGAAGLFARRVEQRRDVLRQIVSEQDGERRRLALDLHDQKAQVLAGALMMLRAAGHAEGATSSEAAERARDLISETIGALRTMAGDLSPRALEQQGLMAALEQLAESLADATGVEIQVGGGFSGRLTFEAELALYRVAQDMLASLIESGAQDIVVTISCAGGVVSVAIGCGGAPANAVALTTPSVHHERLRLLGGRLPVVHSANQGHVFQAEVPARLQLESHYRSRRSVSVFSRFGPYALIQHVRPRRHPRVGSDDPQAKHL